MTRTRTAVFSSALFLLAVAAIGIGWASRAEAKRRDSSASASPDSLLLPDSSKPAFTIPESSLRKPVTIIAYGDMRFTDPAEKKPSNPKVRRELVRQVASEKPAVVLLDGDLPWHGGVTNDYAVYKQETWIWRKDRLRVFPALGNHEFEKCKPEQCLRNWWAAFPQLNRRRWYSVRIGSNLYAITLDSDDSLMPGSRQMEWVKSQIDSLPRGIEFVLFTMHHPPVADPDGEVPRPNEIALRDYLQLAAQSIQARIVVIAAHVHNYERFDQGGVTYIISGGGGAEPDHVTRTPGDLYKDPKFPNYNYVKLVLRGRTLHGTMYRVSSLGKFQPKDSFAVQSK